MSEAAAATDQAEDLRPGAQLRAARERAGLDEVRAAAEMRVDLATLRALEADDYARLGAPIFVKGHLRNYARLLGLEAEALLAAYEAAARPDAPQLVGYRSEGESMDGAPIRENLPVLNWGIALAVCIGVALWAHDNPTLQALIAAPPAAPVAAQAVTEETPEPLAPEPVSGEAPEVTAAQETEPAVETPAPQPVVAAPVASEAPAAAVAAPAAAPAGQLRVQLRFSGESWVEVYDPRGEPLVYELYDAGRSRNVNALPPLRVFLGQANAVTLTVDGRRVDLAPLIKRDGTARFTLAAGGELR